MSVSIKCWWLGAAFWGALSHSCYFASYRVAVATVPWGVPVARLGIAVIYVAVRLKPRFCVMLVLCNRILEAAYRFSSINFYCQ